MFTNALLPLYIAAIYLVNSFIIITLIFFERKNATAILLWSAALLLLPGFGLFLYFFIGKGPILGKNAKYLSRYPDDKEFNRLIDRQKEMLEESGFSVQVKDLVKFNLATGSLFSVNNEVEVFKEVKDYYEDMFRNMENAKSFIHLEVYIYRNDVTGNRLRKILENKAKEGVKIRIIYDDIGCFALKKSFFGEIIKYGGEVYTFFPTFYKYINRNINYRNHRKIISIDGIVSYIGGSNIGDEYLSKQEKTAPWTDCNIRITGEAALHMNMRFAEDLSFAAGKYVNLRLKAGGGIPDFKAERPLPVQMLSGGPDSVEGSIENAYVKALYGAKKRIYIQTPYLVLDRIFFTALVSAVKSGVDVRVMIPQKPDKKFVYYATLAYASDIIREGVKVYLREGFLHSKTLLIDDEICSIGCFNIDVRSFLLHFENTAFIYDAGTAGKLEKIFEYDLTKSREIGREYVSNKPLGQKIKEKIAKLFAPVF